MVEESGERHRIGKRWFGLTVPSRLEILAPYAVGSAGLFALVVLAFLLWNWSLRRALARRQRLLRESLAQLRKELDHRIARERQITHLIHLLKTISKPASSRSRPRRPPVTPRSSPGDGSGYPLPIPVAACRPRRWLISSNPFSQPTRQAKGLALACAPSTGSSHRTAGSLRSRASWGKGAPSTFICPRRRPMPFGWTMVLRRSRRNLSPLRSPLNWMVFAGSDACPGGRRMPIASSTRRRGRSGGPTTFGHGAGGRSG